MKKIILTTTWAIFMLCGMSIQARQTSYAQGSTSDSLVTESFGVRGNCGMCKATIEKAALSVPGVSKAIWDAVNKKVTVTYDSKKTNLDTIHKAIALSGYDTEKIKASETNYNKLPGCCQYDRNMPISKKTTDTKEEKTTKKSKSCH